MSVTIRPYRRGGWEVDIRFTWPDGSEFRERRKAPVSTKNQARRWGRTREQFLLERGPKRGRKEVPTLAEFAPRFLEEYAEANRQKPSGIAAKETILRVHLEPPLGKKKLDAINNEDVQRVKWNLCDKAPKTVNNVLSVLNTLLKVAVAWEVIERMPCMIKLLPVPRTDASFHDFDEYERLVEAAKRTDERAYLIVLLGGEAGLRCGEMMALEGSDIDFSKRQLQVARSDWKGNVTTPKGGRPRRIPMTRRLTKALQAHRHLRGPLVMYQDDGSPLTQKVVRNLVQRAARRANVSNEGVHVLRHTFCSHLAMKGAPARAIQELAGHADLGTTQRYMHMSPAAVDSAIRLLEKPISVPTFGDIVETGST